MMMWRSLDRSALVKLLARLGTPRVPARTGAGRERAKPKPVSARRTGNKPSA